MRFATIVADPPWKTTAGPGKMPYTLDETGKQVWDRTVRPSRPLPYPTLSVPEIAALPVLPRAADDAHLYLWTTNGYLRQAFDVARAWGFAYSTTLVWAKRPMGGGLGGTFGISTEFVLFCRRGSLKAKTRVKGTHFDWKRAYRNGYPCHSVKPPEFMDMVEAVSPGPYLELFARTSRPGWAAWGNEIKSDVELT